MKSFILGPLCLTTTMQSEGAPFVDKCFTKTEDGRRFRGHAVLLTPWRRNRYGESVIQRALVIAWKARAPQGPSCGPETAAA